MNQECARECVSEPSLTRSRSRNHAARQRRLRQAGGLWFGTGARSGAIGIYRRWHALVRAWMAAMACDHPVTPFARLVGRLLQVARA